MGALRERFGAYRNADSVVVQPVGCNMSEQSAFEKWPLLLFYYGKPQTPREPLMPPQGLLLCHHHALSIFLPFRRRLLKTAFPPRVLFLLRNPCLRLRFKFDFGRSVFFIDMTPILWGLC
jgi:hypothetical protein